jgi:hypothetical protein
MNRPDHFKPHTEGHRELFMDLLNCVPDENRGNTAGICSAMFNLGTIEDPIEINKNNILDLIVDMETVLEERFEFWGEPTKGKWCLLSAEFIEMIRRSDYKNLQYRVSSGFMGEIDNMNIYLSHMVPETLSHGKMVKHILFGCPGAIKAEGLGVCCAVRGAA